jgi:hypothetical protein
MNENDKAMPIAACPRCRTANSVSPKLIATNFAVPSEWGFYEPYLVADEKKFQSSPFTLEGYFISALYCAVCDIGFIPDAMLPELGIQKNPSRGGVRENSRPFGVGYPAPDPS